MLSSARETVFINRLFYSAGALGHLSTALKPFKRAAVLIDSYFERSRHSILDQLRPQDLVLYIDNTHEPTVEAIDQVAAKLRDEKQTFDVIIGMGGGATLDTAKAISILLTNPGSASEYQGWDLVKNPALYKIGIPTLSGTGAETSRTCVMTNKKKNIKLGMNSDQSVYNYLILDPELSATVPMDQYFYTAMDTYIHCVESLQGNFRHPLADPFSHQALEMVEAVFTDANPMSLPNRERVMTASFLGGAAIANTYVGVVHPLSAALSVVFGTHHCQANCIVMNVMEEFYPKAFGTFQKMLKTFKIGLPTGLCKNLPEETFKRLYDATVCHEKPLTNALGQNFKEVLTYEKVKSLFARM